MRRQMPGPLRTDALLPRHSACTLAGGESAKDLLAFPDFLNGSRAWATRKAETLQGKALPKNKDLRCYYVDAEHVKRDLPTNLTW